MTGPRNCWVVFTDWDGAADMHDLGVPFNKELMYCGPTCFRYPFDIAGGESNADAALELLAELGHDGVKKAFTELGRIGCPGQ